jgi:hypothetical protein
MNKKLAKRLFKQADELYRGKNYAAALEVLDRLDKEFPDTHRILYPRAMCLAEVGRAEEGIAVCDRLISRHKYKRAEDLKTRIQKLTAVLPQWNSGVGAGVSIAMLDDFNVTRRPTAFAVAPAPAAPGWQLQAPWLIAGVIALLALMAGGGFILFNQ